MTIPNNPTVGQEFTNDETGVTYKWDGERWYVVSTSEADAAATYVKKAGDTMTGELLFDGGNNIMVMNDQSLRLKSSRDDNSNTSATHINVGRNADGDAVTGIYHLQRPQQPEWAVNMEYSDEKDQLLQDQIDDALETQAEIQSELDTLENKVDALEGTVVDGKWYAESRTTPRPGGFDLIKGGLQSMSDWEADFLRLHKTDNTGKVFTFAEISANDYVRIGAPGGTNAVFKIVSVVSGSLDYQSFEVELTNSLGVPMPDLTYDFEFLPSFDPSAYATVAYVDAQDDLDVKLAGSQQLNPVQWRLKQNNQSGNNRTFIDIYDGTMHLYHVADPTNQEDAWAANKGYVDSVAGNYLPLAGGDLTGDIDLGNNSIDSVSHFTLDHGTTGPKEKKFNITGENEDGVDQSILWSYKNDAGQQDAVNYKGKMSVDTNLVNKGYVDNKVATVDAQGVPVGAIMIWMNSTAPAGWFKLQGGSFSTSTYPKLHAYLQNTAGYSSGTLPNWSGHYPGEYGDHMATNLGTKVGARTAAPSGGAPKTSRDIPNGNTRTFNATGGTNAYSDGKAKAVIDSGWDTTTRPKTVVVHYIIKHD